MFSYFATMKKLLVSCWAVCTLLQPPYFHAVADKKLYTKLASPLAEVLSSQLYNKWFFKSCSLALTCIHRLFGRTLLACHFATNVMAFETTITLRVSNTPSWSTISAYIPCATASCELAVKYYTQILAGNLLYIYSAENTFRGSNCFLSFSRRQLHLMISSSNYLKSVRRHALV